MLPEGPSDSEGPQETKVREEAIGAFREPRPGLNLRSHHMALCSAEAGHARIVLENNKTLLWLVQLLHDNFGSWCCLGHFGLVQPSF